MFYEEKLTTVMVADMTQFDDSDINGIDVGGEEVNYCASIGTTNVSDDEN